MHRQKLHVGFFVIYRIDIHFWQVFACRRGNGGRDIVADIVESDIRPQMAGRWNAVDVTRIARIIHVKVVTPLSEFFRIWFPVEYRLNKVVIALFPVAGLIAQRNESTPVPFVAP